MQITQDYLGFHTLFFKSALYGDPNTPDFNNPSIMPEPPRSGRTVSYLILGRILVDSWSKCLLLIFCTAWWAFFSVVCNCAELQKHNNAPFQDCFRQEGNSLFDGKLAVACKKISNNSWARRRGRALSASRQKPSFCNSAANTFDFEHFAIICCHHHFLGSHDVGGGSPF